MKLIVNGEHIEKSEIQREAEQLRTIFQQMPEEERAQHGLKTTEIEKTALEWSRENVIERTLLRQEAEKTTETVAQEEIEKALTAFKKQLANTKKQGEGFDEEMVRKEIKTRIKLDRLIGKLTSQIPSPKNREIAEYYRKNKKQFKMPEMVHAAHIVKNVGDGITEETASQEIASIQHRLRTGETFERLADLDSDCPGDGGDLGCFPRGKMVEEFDRVVFSLNPGVISEIFRTPFGFHIAKVKKHFPECLKSLTEVREEIDNQLRKNKEKKVVERFIDDLRAKAEITTEASRT